MSRVLPVLFVLPLLVSVGCEEPAPPEEPLRPVRSESVRRSSGSRMRSFAGITQAGRETELSFRVSGTLEQLEIKVGDRVSRGDLIARLDPTDFELEVQRAEAALNQAQATSRNASANLERVRGLWENGNASQNDLDASLAQSQSTRALVESAEKVLEQSKRQLGYATLRSPVDGAIASVDVEVNENIERGRTAAVLTSGTRLEVEVAIPEQLIARVRSGDPASVAVDALPGVIFDATVTEVGVAAVGRATTFPLTVTLSNPSQQIRPGMAATVSLRFNVEGVEDRIYVTPVAVGEDRLGRFVFVVEPADEPGVGSVRRVDVEIGPLTPDGIEIVSGLDVGQQVVTAGVRRLTDGQQVRLPRPEDMP